MRLVSKKVSGSTNVSERGYELKLLEEGTGESRLLERRIMWFSPLS